MRFHLRSLQLELDRSGADAQIIGAFFPCFGQPNSLLAGNLTGNFANMAKCISFAAARLA
jgi:hypothetical protein